MKTIISLSARAVKKPAVKKYARKPRNEPALVTTKRAVVPAAKKEKIAKLLAKKKLLLAKHKEAVKAIEASLKSLGYKPSVKHRSMMK